MKPNTARKFIREIERKIVLVNCGLKRRLKPHDRRRHEEALRTIFKIDHSA